MRRLIAILALTCMLASVARARGQCVLDWRAGDWLSGVGGRIDSNVRCMANWDPDGAGPLSPILVTGGSFLEVAGDQLVNNIAAWDGDRWAALGIPVPPFQHCNVLHIFNGEVFAGGTSGIVMRWNGTQWTSLGSPFSSNVNAFVTFDGKLVAAGVFGPSRVKAWDGIGWTQLGPTFNSTVGDLIVYNGELIAAGTFAGGVARWNGSSWTPLGGGTSGGAGWKLAEYAGELVLFGTFTAVGGVPAIHIAAWNGASWRPLGGGLPNQSPGALRVWKESLIAVSGSSPQNIAVWNGSIWTALPNTIWSGISSVSFISDLHVHNDELYACGEFNIPGWSVARFTGQAWERLGRGMNAYVSATAVHNGQLVMGGGFITAGDISANRIVRHDGESYHPLGSGVNGYVNALVSTGDALYAGGSFTQAGGIDVGGVARWDGKSWCALAGGMGGTTPTIVYALTEYDGMVVAGGFFTNAGSKPNKFIAAWNGTDWINLSSGMNDTVTALTTYNGELIAGGYFTTAGGVSVDGVARWDGTSWRAIGGGLDLGVLSLWVHNGQLIAGGEFGRADGQFIDGGLARWDGSHWSGFPLQGVANVYALASYNGDLIAGGSSISQGQNIVRLDQSWNPISMGIGIQSSTGSVETLSVYKNELFIGGEFFKAGGKATGYFARWRPACPRGDMNCDSGVTLGDVDPFATTLLSPDAVSDCQKYLADVNGDGENDGRDVQPFIAAAAN